jgi:hypothetical protein
MHKETGMELQNLVISLLLTLTYFLLQISHQITSNTSYNAPIESP